MKLINTYSRFLLAATLCLAALTTTSAQCPGGTITITSQAGVDNFCIIYPGCTMIPGFLFIQNSQDITNLNGLGCLTSIDGLLIGFNGVLSDLTGLENLTSIGGNLSIGFNDMLIDLTGLENITSIGSKLTIVENPMLSDLTDLENLTFVGGLLSIRDNDMLIDLMGLENLTFIGGNLFIGDNAMLSDLTGLNNLTSVGENLIIQDNSMLSDCCVLCPLLTEDNMDDSVIVGSIDINNNLNGCNSEAEVEACTLCGATAENVPTVQEWGLILLGLLMLIAAVVGIRQRREEKAYS